MPDIRTVLRRYNSFMAELPNIVADEIIDWVVGNFDSQSYEGSPWPERKDRDGSRNLLVKSSRGRRSIRVAEKSWNSIKVTTDLDYMIAHNDGAEVTMQITPRMRKFFWAMHYKYEVDLDNNLVETYENSKWKWMALMKGPITFKMPQRQFFGDSEELDKRIREGIEFELKKVFI